MLCSSLEQAALGTKPRPQLLPCPALPWPGHTSALHTTSKITHHAWLPLENGLTSEHILATNIINCVSVYCDFSISSSQNFLIMYILLSVNYYRKFFIFFTNITLVCSDSWLTQSDSDRLLEPCPQLRCLMKELRLKSNLSLCRAYTSLREWGGRVKARPAVWLAYSSLLSFYLGRLLAALSRPDS